MEKNGPDEESAFGSVKRKKMALGRGLGALIPEFEPGGAASPSDVFHCDIRLIHPNRFQPRIRFPEPELEELAASVKAQGIIQPLVVRKDEGGYELVAGERRLRAARKAGLEKVPVVVRRLTDGQMLEMTLVENIQREDLNPLEESEAYHRLMEEFRLTQQEVAERVGKSRSAVANFLRLRQLPEAVKSSLLEGRLSMGHARALLSLEKSAQLNAAWRAVLAKGLSVRETEALVNRIKAGKPSPPPSGGRAADRLAAELAEELSRLFGTRVRIRRKGQKGRVEIEFYSAGDLDHLISRLREV